MTAMKKLIKIQINPGWACGVEKDLFWLRSSDAPEFFEFVRLIGTDVTDSFTRTYYIGLGSVKIFKVCNTTGLNDHWLSDTYLRDSE